MQHQEPGHPTKGLWGLVGRMHALVTASGVVLGCFWFALPASAATAAVPQRVEIAYRVSVGSLRVGEGHDLLQHDGKTYDLVSESKTSGIAALIYRLSVSRRST